jgi:stress response protein SCP2
MGIDLQKGHKIDLTKGNAGLVELMVGLGWDPVASVTGTGGGFFSKVFGGGKPAEIDCDASVIMLNEQGKLSRKEHIIYFGNLKSPCGSVQHMGDNRTGGGDGDDEQILLTFSKVPADVQRIVFVVNIYDCEKRKQDFGMIRNAFIRVVNKSNMQELAKYNLTDNYAGKTSLIVGEVYRHQGEWKFAAIGDGTNDTSLGKLVARYS